MQREAMNLSVTVPRHTQALKFSVFSDTVGI